MKIKNIQNSIKKYTFSPFILLLFVVIVNIVFGFVGVQKISFLEKQVAQLQGNFYDADSPTIGKTRDQLITEAVETIIPSVVSIVITKETQSLSDMNDIHFFREFNLSIPYYSQEKKTKEKVGGGTGFVVSEDGYIVTNKHVVDDDDAEYSVLFSNQERKSARVVYKDPSIDIALLKIKGTYKPIPFGDSSHLKVGQSVIAIGNALGEYNNTVSVGIVSGLDRSIRATDELGNPEDLSGVIQIDASINRGNSGGPLIDLGGKVIGINVATVVGSSNISFAIPINTIKDMLRRVVTL